MADDVKVQVYDPEWEYMLSVKYGGCDMCPKCGMPLENGRCPECDWDWDDGDNRDGGDEWTGSISL